MCASAPAGDVPVVISVGADGTAMVSSAVNGDHIVKYAIDCSARTYVCVLLFPPLHCLTRWHSLLMYTHTHSHCTALTHCSCTLTRTHTLTHSATRVHTRTAAGSRVCAPPPPSGFKGEPCGIGSVAVVPGRGNGTLVVGTRRGDIFSIPAYATLAPKPSRTVVRVTDAVPVTRGHCDGEVRDCRVCMCACVSECV